MKSCENLICYLWIINVKLHVHLKKWTLKFKLLYLRNYIRYFNKIRSICCMNTNIQRLKVWLKSILSWLKYSIFSKGLFFIGAPFRVPELSCHVIGIILRLVILILYRSVTDTQTNTRWWHIPCWHSVARWKGKHLHYRWYLLLSIYWDYNFTVIFHLTYV